MRAFDFSVDESRRPSEGSPAWVYLAIGLGLIAVVSFLLGAGFALLF